MSIDWSQTPIYKFEPGYKEDPERPRHWRWLQYPMGEGEAQKVMEGLARGIGAAYQRLLPVEYDEETGEYRDDVYYLREITPDKTFAEGKDVSGTPPFGDAEVPIIRNGRREYERLDSFTLADLPAILDTLAVLEDEQKERERVRKEHKAAEQKNRSRIRAKERRKLKKLGEW